VLDVVAGACGSGYGMASGTAHKISITEVENNLVFLCTRKLFICFSALLHFGNYHLTKAFKSLALRLMYQNISLLSRHVGGVSDKMGRGWTLEISGAITR
jgi:hypothetical protein